MEVFNYVFFAAKRKQYLIKYSLNLHMLLHSFTPMSSKVQKIE